MLRPAAGHALNRDGRRRQRAHAMIEAGYQFATMLAHPVARRPLGSQLGWLAMTADVPCAVPAATGLGLRWPVRRLAGRRIACGTYVVVYSPAR